MNFGRTLTDLAGRLGISKPGLDVYVFGKHPAWPDFIDVARLPPVPPSFRHFHDKLRPGVDAVYTEPAAVPRLLLWTARGGSGIVAVHPSRDGGNPRTGQFRRSPLLIGMHARSPLQPLLNFGGEKITSLAAQLSDPAADDRRVIGAITAAAASWRADFSSMQIPSPAPDRTPPTQLLPVSPSHTDLLIRARDAVGHFVTDRTPTVLTVAATPAGLLVARIDWDRLDAEALRGALGGNSVG